MILWRQTSFRTDKAGRSEVDRFLRRRMKESFGLTNPIDAEKQLTRRDLLEFNAYFLLGNVVPASVCGGKVNLKIYPTDEIGYTEYHIRLGMNLPNTSEYLQKVILKLPDPTERHIMVYETLTHADDVSSSRPSLRVPANLSGRRF